MIIAIDIGGTMIKYGLVSQEGEILESAELPTEASLGLDNILKKIDNIVMNYKQNYEIIGVALSGTGQIDGIRGKIIGGNPIIPNWIGTNLVEIMEKKYSLPSILENDVNCAALGEKWKGAGKNLKNFICLTIGTGIGGGIILDGKLFRGEGFVAGEFGHIQIKNGKEYEESASTTALVKMVKEKLGKDLNGKQIFELEKNNDDEIKKIINEWIEYIADGLASIVYVFNPKHIILGGGVTKQGQHFLDRIKNNLDKKISIRFREDLKIIAAELGNDAGMLGASYLLLQKIKNK